VTVKVTGFIELDAALKDLTRAAGKAALRRAGIKALEPIAESARSKAPSDPATGGYDLKSSITVGTKLSRSQRRRHRKMVKNDKSSVEVFVGAGPLAQALHTEFGTSPFISGGKFAGAHNPGIPAQPWMRPAWDGGKARVVQDLKTELWVEVEKAAKRAARKRARAAKG
jgi:HK97 gp10 family phage protein